MPPAPCRKTSGSPEPPSRYFTGAWRVSTVLVSNGIEILLLGGDGLAGRRARGRRRRGGQRTGRNALVDRVAPEAVVVGEVREHVPQLGHHLLGEQLGGIHALVGR